MKTNVGKLTLNYAGRADVDSVNVFTDEVIVEGQLVFLCKFWYLMNTL